MQFRAKNKLYFSQFNWFIDMIEGRRNYKFTTSNGLTFEVYNIFDENFTEVAA